MDKNNISHEGMMKNILWEAGRENGKFYADITDYYNNERVTMTAKTRAQLIELLETEIDRHRADKRTYFQFYDLHASRRYADRAMHERRLVELLIHIVECTRFPEPTTVG